MITMAPERAQTRQEIVSQYEGLRQRDAAHAAGMTEGELIAAGAGIDTWQLNPDWPELFKGYPGIGSIMSLVRNEACVHELKGTMTTDMTITDQIGQVVEGDIDLRLFPGRWGRAYLVHDEMKGSTRPSVQLYDKQGNAIQKVFPIGDGASEKLQAHAESLKMDSQTPGWTVDPATEPVSPLPDATVDVAGFQRDWDAMTDTHQFFGILKNHGLQRTQALRLAGEPRAWRVDPTSLLGFMQTIAAEKITTLTFVGNPGILQIYTGTINKIMPMENWVNVMDPSYNLHCRADLVDQAWVVTKPTKEGSVYSFELFAEDGSTIAMIFGARKLGRDAMESFGDVVRGLPRLEVKS